MKKANMRKILNQKEKMKKSNMTKNPEPKKKKTAKRCIKQKIFNAENFYQQIRQGP